MLPWYCFSFSIGRYYVAFLPWIGWEDLDCNLTTWCGRYKNLGKNITEFGPFRISQKR
jgi:hypothetical protein